MNYELFLLFTDGRIDSPKVLPVRKIGSKYQLLGEKSFMRKFSARNKKVIKEL